MDEDIGIIAPYHAQCLKVRKALKDIAKELGLETSYLERLMDRDAYDIKTGHGRR